jgi:pimeloyl-ACP methyl ester carboxylesterase
MRVILLHGLRMNRHVMAFLAGALARHGFDAVTWSYPSATLDLQQNAMLLAERLATETSDKLALVGHSYGGVVALACLARRRDPRVHRIVLMAAPVRGSSTGAQMTRYAAGQWFVGKSWGMRSEEPDLQVPPGIEAGAIAGRSPVALGRLLVRLEGPNDGIIAVEETKMPGLADHIVLPVAHSQMLVSPRVAQQVAHFLRHGRFNPAD